MFKSYDLPKSDVLRDCQPPLFGYDDTFYDDGSIKVLSLFSGCGGMDLGFEGHFLTNKKSVPNNRLFVEKAVNSDWVLLNKTKFKTIFANDILPEAESAWLQYMRRFNDDDRVFHNESVVDLVKMQKMGIKVFPDNVDVVTGGFPCQDFSVAGNRKGFNSNVNHLGAHVSSDIPSEETRGKLYCWMKQVIDITKPKMFIAENVKGLVNLGNVKDIIQSDFAKADDNGYIVLEPKILHAANYGVPESRERVIFIGIRRDALNSDVLKIIESGVIPEDINPYPSPTHSYNNGRDDLLKPVVTRDVLEGLPEPEDSIDPSQKVFSKAKYLGNGCQGQIEIDLDKISPTIRSEHHGNIEFRRLAVFHGGKHLRELKSGMKERRLTPRECAMIQTFPPDYQFVSASPSSFSSRNVSASGAYKIIGNAVPPVLAFNIAMKIQTIWSLYFD